MTAVIVVLLATAGASALGWWLKKSAPDWSDDDSDPS